MFSNFIGYRLQFKGRLPKLKRKKWFGMDDHMKKTMLSQARIDQDERMRGAVDIGMFSSMLGADFAGKLHRDALDWSDMRSHQVPRPAMEFLHPKAKATATCAAARTATSAAACSVATVPADATASSTASCADASSCANPVPDARREAAQARDPKVRRD